MDDQISRAAAIEALSTPCDKRYRHGVWETCLDNIETAIRNIPAVDAVPVGWLKQSRDKLRTMGEYQQDCADMIEFVLRLWQKEQEAST